MFYEVKVYDKKGKKKKTITEKRLHDRHWEDFDLDYKFEVYKKKNTPISQYDYYPETDYGC